MSRIYETVRVEIENQFRDEQEGDTNALARGSDKAITLRLPRYLLHAIDTMAALVHNSRNAFMVDVLTDAMNEAVDGYCAAHGKGNEVSARKAFFELIEKLEGGTLRYEEDESK